MRLNDPFGRLESRHQKGYENMRSALRQAGIETRESAEAVVKQAIRRGVAIVTVGVLLLLLMAGLIPKSAPLALGLALFLAVWVVSSTVNGQRYIKRYIEEELKE
jgi:hypothetical protein